MSYATEDFTESLNRVGIELGDIERVIAAWGHGEGMGVDAGHFKFSDPGASDWSGGFLMHLKDGRYCYVTGWCDYTGWGCQDGAQVLYYDEEPTVASLVADSAPTADQWDLEPADLNRSLSVQGV